VSFEDACEAFFDPFLVVDDEEVAGEEARDAIVGMTTHWQVLYVIHTIRFGDRFRIFSAREATPAKGNAMKASELKNRLQKDRPMISISMRIPEDVIDDLKRVAPQLGFSGYQPLIRAYIGQGLRQDIARLESSSIDSFVESLRLRGVDEDVIKQALTDSN
jgi:uncharacterized DUF497 family protein